MKIESTAQQFLARVQERGRQAAQDTADEARHNLGGGGALSASVRVHALGPDRWHIGSDHPGAMAQERGAFVRPRRRRALKFAGRFSMHARIPPKRWLSRAGQAFGEHLVDRLRGG